MTPSPDSLHAQMEHLKRVVPEVLDLATARTDEEFCACFNGLLEKAVMHLEKNAKNFGELNEVGLTAVLAACFLGYGVTVVQEGNSNGHVDLTIEVRLVSPVQRRLAEAKIERSPATHEQGLDQLLRRYSTGRESSGWIILYVKSANISARMKALRDNLDRKMPLQQVAACEEHPIKWAFVSKHVHSSGETLRVEHVGCNLHII